MATITTEHRARAKVYCRRFQLTDIHFKVSKRKIFLYATDQDDIDYRIDWESWYYGMTRPSLRAAISKTKLFILRARKIHGDRYDYSKVTDAGFGDSKRNLKVTVTCKAHGDFEVRPNNHTSKNPTGCPICKKKR